MTKKIITRLMNIATTSFDFNHRAGRRGKEWALESEITYQAAKLIEELEAALAPFAKYSNLGLNGSKPYKMVVSIYANDPKTNEPDGIELEARHFNKARTLLGKK